MTFRTFQELFDTAAKGVITQGKPSGDDGGCWYVSGDDLHCGVGHLLADNPMCERWDSKGWSVNCIQSLLEEDRLENQLVKDFETIRIPLDGYHLKFLKELQSAHDNASSHHPFLDHFRTNMRNVASEYGLTSMLSDTQRANLTTLAAYLETLPKDYSDFDMRSFVRDKSNYTPDYDQSWKSLYLDTQVIPCGTAACAVGHGPAAGIPFDESDFDKEGDLEWIEYSTKFAPLRDDDDPDQPRIDVWNFLFGSDWTAIDNTPHGAADRIRHILADKPMQDHPDFNRFFKYA